MNVRQEILDLLKQVKREGIEELIKFLEETDYFTAPASVKYHDSHVGGLSLHSLRVYKLLKNKENFFHYGIPEESLIICGLLHDLCKVNYYKIVKEQPTTAQINYLQTLLSNNNLTIDTTNLSRKYVSELINCLKNGNMNLPKQTEILEYKIEDDFPLGHGEKSIAIIRDFIKLTKEEMLAIRWHMSYSDDMVHCSNSYKSYNQAMMISSLVILLFTADFESITYSNFENKGVEK